MYICLECGHIFEEPYTYAEYRGECHGFPSFERFRECPKCGGEYEETQRCVSCSAIIGKSQAKYGLCPTCETATEQRFEQLLKENFTRNELEYLNMQYDERNFGLEKEAYNANHQA